MHPALPILTNHPLRGLNTFAIDARAAAYLQVTGSTMLDQVRADPALAGLVRLVLGGGSNILLTRDFPGLVLHMVERGIALVGQDAHGIRVRAAAGESWHGLVLWTLAHGLGGLENLSLIPGSVGASPIQNIGAYGVEAGNLIESVRYYDMESGDIVMLDRAGCEFGYRDSVFKHRLRDRAVILDVTFVLPVHWRPNLGYAELQQELAKMPEAGIDGAVNTAGKAAGDPTATASTIPAAITATAISAAVISIRTRKLPDPAQIGNAGSFFKNPVVSAETRDALLAQMPALVSHVQADGTYKLAAGWLIDQCGWKGRSLGAAGVYEKQALVLVNRGAATGADIMKLAAAIQADVRRRFGVSLEPEPVFI